jgi:predicted dehydrogenase
MTKNELKVAVIGVGYVGKEHARIYHGMSGVHLVGVCDTDPKRAEAVASDFSTQTFADHKELLDKVDAASIATPTKSHFKIASDFLEAGIPALVEKPMTTNVDEADRLVALAEKTGVALQVGFVERFSPVIEAAKKLNINPKFIEAHRLAPFSFRSADIGVVLDLMIHDIDIVLHLAGAEIKKLDACGVAVIGDKEDIANARFTFASGCVANITASRVATQALRRMRIFSPDSYISLDFGLRKGYLYKKSAKLTSWRDLKLTEDVSSIADLKGYTFGDLLDIREIPMGEWEPLQKELESFVHSVRTGTAPVVPAEEGRLAIATATRILEAIEEHSWEEP